MAKIDPLAVLNVLGNITDVLTKAQAVIDGESVEKDFTVKTKGDKFAVSLKITKID